MLLIPGLKIYSFRFEDEHHLPSDRTERIYREVFSFVRRIKGLKPSDPKQIETLYSLAERIVIEYRNLKEKNGIGSDTNRFIKELNDSLKFCGQNKLLFYAYSRTTIYKQSLLNKVASDFYMYKKTITFVNQFQNDYDRIVSSSAFRRLQDKAQVFSLESFDYVRTRLTHSNEVAAISEQLISKIMYDALNLNSNLLQHIHLKELCKCSSLLHDIGNPPFGHYGEHIIRHFFEALFSPNSNLTISSSVAVRIKTKLRFPREIIKTKRMVSDFTYFDGNAQAFRIINNLQQYRNKTTLNLTASTLMSIIKYPCSSVNLIEKGKFGYFYSEQPIIEFLEEKADYQDGYIYFPALIMETADDISYNISDFEDSCKKGLITYEDIMTADISKETIEVKNFISDFKKYYKINQRHFNNPNEITLVSLIQELKIKLISEAAFKLNNPKAVAYYLDRTNKNRHVLDDVPSYSICVFIKNQFIKKRVYNSRMISENELEADSIMSYVLEELTKTVLYVDFESKSKKLLKKDKELNIDKYKKILNLISPHLIDGYVKHAKDYKTAEEKLYYRLKIVVDYVSGMTDSYCKHIFDILKG